MIGSERGQRGQGEGCQSRVLDIPVCCAEGFRLLWKGQGAATEAHLGKNLKEYVLERSFCWQAESRNLLFQR